MDAVVGVEAAGGHDGTDQDGGAREPRSDQPASRGGRRFDPRRLVPAWLVQNRLTAAVLLAVNVPIMVAVARALARGWQPVGDNGILLVRARDVATSHHPLLGTWTSASLVLGEHLNNPGPLYFDAVAPAVRLLGPWVGAAVGVMLVNMAAVSLAVVAARRINGDAAMVGVGLAIVGLQWALGSELLFDMWQPNALVLPFFAFIVVAAALATGDLAMAPWVAGVGSFVVQTHMSHAVLVGALSAVGTVLCVVALRRHEEPVPWRRPVAWTGMVVLLAWSQPLIEQFAGSGKGNLSRIAGAATSGVEPIGWTTATRMLVEITAMGPWFTRGAYADAVPSTPVGEPVVGIVSLGAAAVIQVAILVVLAAVAVRAYRTGRPRLAAMAVTAAAALLCAHVALATSPMNQIGLSLHQMRWLWPVAAFVTASGVTIVLETVGSRRELHRWLLAGTTVLVVALAIANLPTHRSESTGPIETAHHLNAGRELVNQLGSLEGRGTVLYDAAQLTFAEPYSGMTFAELLDRGIPFVFDDEGLIRQFGEERRADGSEALRLWQVAGSGALETPPGAERVAFAEGPSGPVALFVEPLD